MEVDMTMQEPRSSVIGPEAECCLLVSNTSVHYVTDDLSRKTEKAGKREVMTTNRILGINRAARTLNDVEIVLEQVNEIDEPIMRK